MLSLPPSVRIFVATQPADLRRSFDGLAALVRDFLAGDPLSGHLFVFRNKRGDRLKVLYWDRDGLAIWYKRLEEGTFDFPATTTWGTGLGISADLRQPVRSMRRPAISRSGWSSCIPPSPLTRRVWLEPIYAWGTY
jgi:transposase